MKKERRIKRAESATAFSYCAVHHCMSIVVWSSNTIKLPYCLTTDCSMDSAVLSDADGSASGLVPDAALQGPL